MHQTFLHVIYIHIKGYDREISLGPSWDQQQIAPWCILLLCSNAYILDVFSKSVLYPQAAYSIMFCSDQGGREKKNRFRKSYFMASRKEIGPNSEYISGLDVGCCWIIDSPTGRRCISSAVNKRTPASRTSCTAVNANNSNNQEFDPKTPSDHYYCPLKVIYKIHFYLIISLNQYRVDHFQSTMCTFWCTIWAYPICGNLN